MNKEIFISIILVFMLELLFADFSNLDMGFWLRILSSVCIALVMFFTLRERKKEEKH